MLITKTQSQPEWKSIRILLSQMPLRLVANMCLNKSACSQNFKLSRLRRKSRCCRTPPLSSAPLLISASALDCWCLRQQSWCRRNRWCQQSHLELRCLAVRLLSLLIPIKEPGLGSLRCCRLLKLSQNMSMINLEF